MKKVYHNRSTQEAANFADELKENATVNGTFDSTAAADFTAGGAIPEKLALLLDEVGDDNKAKVTKAILDGVALYEAQHGVSAPGDIIESAIHMAYATTDHARKQFALDSTANSLHSEPLSLQPNRAIVAILSALGEAIPFAHYLPADIGSNQAKLAILSHQAGSTYGQYQQGGLMDGAFSGDSYISSSRVHATTNAAGAHTGQLTSQQATDRTCTAVGTNGAVAVNLIRGRSIVYINGKVAAREINSTGSGNSTVSGSVTLAGTTYQIGGTINTDTGAIALTSTPALGNAVPVLVEGYIDYERMPSLTPSIITAVDTFDLYAKPWRVITRQTVDTRTQMSNELGLDPYSESIISIQAQFGNERHYEVLRKAREIGVNNTSSFDFAWSTMGAQKIRADVWRDFSAVLGSASQQMALDTLSHGITHLYVDKYVMSQLLGLPADIFTPARNPVRAAIYRVGTLFGQYEVYYSPKVISSSASTGQILAVGQAPDVTRNCFVLGDAVPPTVIPLSVGDDMRQGAGFYARNFTEVNPHGPSSMGAAVINVTNMGL